MALEFTAYTECSKFAVFHVAMSTFECAFRSFLRALSPGTANDARAEFKSIYESLLRTQLSFPEEDLSLLELVRLIRNTVHNEGLHKPAGKKSVDISFRGHTYSFTESAPIEFVTWHFVLERLADLIDLQDRVIRSPQLWNRAERIPADWAEILPPSAA
jgi:hypothetical protein